jgi:levanase
LLRFRPGSAKEFGVVLKSQSREITIVGYDAHAERVFVDRRASGETGFNPVFAA